MTSTGGYAAVASSAVPLGARFPVDADEIERLVALYDACERVTALARRNEDALVRAIRETCEDVEQRLTALGLRIDDP